MSKEPRFAADLVALVDPDERDHALDALREGMPADAMADTVGRLIVVPLLTWIEQEHQRAGRRHKGAEAGARMLSVAEEIVYRCRHDQEVIPEHFDALGERWNDWLAAMAQGTAALQRRAQADRDRARTRGGKTRAGKVSPFTATVCAMVKAMADATPDKMAAALRVEMLADAEGRESVLAGIREAGLPCVRFVKVEVENFTFIDANGKTKTQTFKSLQNAVAREKKIIRDLSRDA